MLFSSLKTLNLNKKGIHTFCFCAINHQNWWIECIGSWEQMTLFGQILVISSNDLQHRYISYFIWSNFILFINGKVAKKFSEFGSEIFEGVTFLC